MQIAAPSRPSLPQIVRGVSLCLGIGALGALFTELGLRSWYPTLEKPPVAPPSWIFAPVSLALALMMGCALAYLWAAPAAGQSARKERALKFFWVQLGLQLAWSAAFFALRSPAWGYALIIFLWLTLIGFLWVGSKVSGVAAWLVLPSFLWVTYASTLNFGILSLNVIKPKVALMDADKENQDPFFAVKNPFAEKKRAEEAAKTPAASARK